MPTPPRDGETKEEFMSRCMSVMKNEDKPQEQKIAICFSMWRKKDGKKKAEKDEEKPNG